MSKIDPLTKVTKTNEFRSRYTVTSSATEQIAENLTRLGMTPGWVERITPGLADVIHFGTIGSSSGSVSAGNLTAAWRHDEEGDLIVSLSFTTTEP